MDRRVMAISLKAAISIGMSRETVERPIDECELRSCSRFIRRDPFVVPPVDRADYKPGC